MSQYSYNEVTTGDSDTPFETRSFNYRFSKVARKLMINSYSTKILLQLKKKLTKKFQQKTNYTLNTLLTTVFICK